MSVPTCSAWQQSSVRSSRGVRPTWDRRGKRFVTRPREGDQADALARLTAFGADAELVSLARTAWRQIGRNGRGTQVKCRVG